MARTFPGTLAPGETDQTLTATFPSYLCDPERLVYQAVKAAVTPDQDTGMARVGMFADQPGPEILTVRGWPAYPGQVPAIGVAAGPETTDQSTDINAGGLAGDTHATDQDTGELVGVASYYSEPLYATVVVELIHENRDERDRLHDLLRLVLFPLRRQLPASESTIHRVHVDAEKSDQSVGTPASEQPMLIYISLFTVHVYHELLEATNIAGPGQVTDRIDVTGEIPDAS